MKEKERERARGCLGCMPYEQMVTVFIADMAREEGEDHGEVTRKAFTVILCRKRKKGKAGEVSLLSNRWINNASAFLRGVDKCQTEMPSCHHEIGLSFHCARQVVEENRGQCTLFASRLDYLYERTPTTTLIAEFWHEQGQRETDTMRSSLGRGWNSGEENGSGKPMISILVDNECTRFSWGSL